MKKIFILFLLFQISFGFSQQTNRQFESYSWKNNILEINTSNGKYIIKPYSDQIIETTFLPKGENLIADSHAVVLLDKYKKANIKNNKKTIELNANGFVVSIQKSPFEVSYIYKNKFLISEKNGFKQQDSTQTIDFNLDSTEKLFGGGARVLGMNRRGNRLQLYNRADYGYQNHSQLMNFTIPLVLSSKIYAVHFDNAPIGYLDLDSKKNNVLTYETISGRKTYQVIAGNSWANLIENYTLLTGRQPLPPRWALGNFASRFGYHSQEEVEKTIAKFEQDKIPVDAIILDLYWFGKTIKGTMGNLEFDKDNFPEPDKMIAKLNEKGVKTVLITEPFILTNSKKWPEAVAKKVLVVDKTGKPFSYDFYFGNTSIIDIFKPEAKIWFWKIYKNLIKSGVSGLWGDLGEPEVFPSKAITSAGKADEVHNVYGHYWAKLIADGYRHDFPEQRPFILMRAGYSGSQHFGMIPWSGDVSRSWGGLQGQPEIVLQMGMQGLGYMHSDLGGFAGDYFDNELYIRWLQYGVFQPIFRPHAQEDVASEAVYKDIITKEKAKKQIELRYQMLPYNYNLAFENNQKGWPLMRPIFFEEPNNEKMLESADQYFWGDSFLVAPITKPGILSKSVYFPIKNNWFDFVSDEKHLAGNTDQIAVMQDHIPVFVRAGAFVSMIKTIQNCSFYSLENFDLHFYFDPKTTHSFGSLYNDNGLMSNAFEKNNYEIISFENIFENNRLLIKIKTETGKNFVSKDKNITLIVHNIGSPKKVLVDQKSISFEVNKNKLEIIVSGKNKEIEIEY